MSSAIRNKGLVETGKRNAIRALRLGDFPYTVLGRFVIYRLIRDRDIKIVITSKGTQTGTGKTTLAILLSREIQRLINEIYETETIWTASEYGFMDIWEYMELYEQAEQPAVFTTDELELVMDKRRSMSNQNIKVSQIWSLLRYKNCVTVATAPNLHDLDLRVREHTDIWINVITQGQANVYYMTQNDFTGEPIYRRLKFRGKNETINWLPIPKSDPDYQALYQEKKNRSVLQGYNQQEQTESPKELDRQIRYEIMAELYEQVQENNLNLDQAQIGKICGPGNDGYSQQTVSKAYKQYASNGQSNEQSD